MYILISSVLVDDVCFCPAFCWLIWDNCQDAYGSFTFLIFWVAKPMTGLPVPCPCPPASGGWVGPSHPKWYNKQQQARTCLGLSAERHKLNPLIWGGAQTIRPPICGPDSVTSLSVLLPEPVRSPWGLTEVAESTANLWMRQGQSNVYLLLRWMWSPNHAIQVTVQACCSRVADTAHRLSLIFVSLKRSALGLGWEQ